MMGFLALVVNDDLLVDKTWIFLRITYRSSSFTLSHYLLLLKEILSRIKNLIENKFRLIFLEFN